MPYKSRLAGCIAMAKNYNKIRVKDFEKDSFFTYNLIKKLKAKYPQAGFYFIAGADILPQFHQWKNHKKLLKMVKFAIFSRRSSEKPRHIFKEFLLFNTKNYDISSSEIRAKS